MSNQFERKLLEEKVSSCFSEKCVDDKNRIVLNLQIPDLEESFKIIKKDLAFISLLDICGVDNSRSDDNFAEKSKRFSLVYHLLNMEVHQVLCVKVELDELDQIYSVSNLWKNAEWFEREASEMFGVKFTDRDYKKLLLSDQVTGFPMRKDWVDESSEVSEQDAEIEVVADNSCPSCEIIVLDSINPAICAPIKLAVEVEGEEVQNVVTEIGLFHRGIEKLCEEINFTHSIQAIGKLSTQMSELNAVGWCKAVEELLGVDITDRAQAIRMMFCELGRISDHLTSIGRQASISGLDMSEIRCLKLKRMIADLFIELNLSFGSHPISRIGGLRSDLSPGWIFSCFEVLKNIDREINSFFKNLNGNKIWLDRLKIGRVSAKEAVTFGYSGPALRASGINYDLRKNNSYYFYGDVEFEVPLGINGTAYDRYLVRIEEIKQSLKIVSQILDNIPSGDVNVTKHNICLPEKSDLLSDPEEMKRHKRIITKGIIPEVGEVYSETEVSNGQLGFYIISDGSSTPYRVKIKTPSFSIFQSIPVVSKGLMLSDIPTLIQSLNITTGECDR